MRILFIFARPTPYDSHTVRALPCGGTEKAVIFLGEALAKLGYDVRWATTTQDVDYWLNNNDRPEVVITQIAQLLEHFPSSLRVWWTHHFSDQPVIQQNVGYARAYADKVVTLSHSHALDFSSSLRLNSVTIGHGVWLEEVQRCVKDRYRLIYASTPFRGLERIPELFRAIKEREPRATIGIASSMRTYGDADGDQQYAGLLRELESIDGVELLGALNQEALYREYARASIFFYPCIWPETYCLALDEAIAHGCFVAAPLLGALGDEVYFDHHRGPHTRLDYILGPSEMNGHHLAGIFGIPPLDKSPRDWMDVARQWETEVLS